MKVSFIIPAFIEDTFFAQIVVFDSVLFLLRAFVVMYVSLLWFDRDHKMEQLARLTPKRAKEKAWWWTYIYITGCFTSLQIWNRQKPVGWSTSWTGKGRSCDTIFSFWGAAAFAKGHNCCKLQFTCCALWKNRYTIESNVLSYVCRGVKKIHPTWRDCNDFWLLTKCINMSSCSKQKVFIYCMQHMPSIEITLVDAFNRVKWHSWKDKDILRDGTGLEGCWKSGNVFRGALR